MSLIKYPYTNLHEINLDWLIEEVKKCYSPENPPDMAVLSVNGMTGNVTLYTDPAAVFPAIEGNTWSLGRTAAGSLVGIKFNKNLPLQRMNGTSLFNIYDAGNPPPYPVTSVNGRTGAVQVQEAFFSLTGDTITFITDSPDHSWSLDRATLDGSISLRLDTTNNTPSAYLEYVSADDTVSRTIKLLTPDDIPSSSGVVSVNGMAGVVTVTAEDIHRARSDTENVNHALDALEADTRALHDNIGTVGSTSLQTQVNTINTKIGNVGNTPLQTQINTINSRIITKEKFEAVSAWGNYHDVNTTITLTKDVTQAKAVLVQVGWNQGSSGYAEPIYYKMLVGEHYNVVYALNNNIKTITFTLTSGTLITITGSTDSDIGIRGVYAVF